MTMIIINRVDIMYTFYEYKGWAQDAFGYNLLAMAWPRNCHGINQSQHRLD